MPKYGDIQTKKQSKAMFSLDNTKQSTIKMVANNNNNKMLFHDLEYKNMEE